MILADTGFFLALAWSRGSGNMVTITPRMTVEVRAPPTPWVIRAAKYPPRPTG